MRVMIWADMEGMAGIEDEHAKIDSKEVGHTLEGEVKEKSKS